MGRRPRNNNPATAKRLVWLRITNEKSQQVVADFCGVHQTTLGEYERGVCMPGPEVLRQLADYYNVSPYSLLGRTEERKNLSV